MLAAGLGTAAVALLAQELVGFDPGGLIAMIHEAVRTADQNKQDCELLAQRVDTLAALLPRLQEQEQEQEQEAMRQLAELRRTLTQAHKLVVCCQRKGRTNRFFHGSSLADRFRDVNKKIDDFLAVFPLISYIGIVSRLDGSTTRSSSSPPPEIVRHHAATTPAAPHHTAVHDDDDEELLTSTTLFTLAEIKAATNNFAVVVSDGDDATVYKGRLHDGRQVAVKRLKKPPAGAAADGSGWLGRRGGSAAAEDAFFTEVSILAPLRHDHIVRLVGQCADGDRSGERIIVTQPCASHGSLYDHLHNHHPSPVTASWKARVQVLLGAARAVKHLHCHAVPLVIHCNVTSCSILLDAAEDTSVLSGFGASVWRAAGVESQAVEVAPAAGYADPEYCATGRLKPASDVYGLGVVMLEALTGTPPVVTVWDEGSGATVPMDLVSVALPAIRDDGRLLDVLDRRPAAATWQLQPLQMVADTAARCLRMHADSRPPIADVVANLEQALHLIMSRPAH